MNNTAHRYLTEGQQLEALLHVNTTVSPGHNRPQTCIAFSPKRHPAQPRSEKYRDALLFDLSEARKKLAARKDAAVAGLATKVDMESQRAATRHSKAHIIASSKKGAPQQCLWVYGCMVVSLAFHGFCWEPRLCKRRMNLSRRWRTL